MATIIATTFLVLALLFGLALFLAVRSAARREWRFELASVIGNSFVAIGRNIGLFLGVTLTLLALPYAALVWVTQVQATPGGTAIGGGIWAFWIGYLLLSVLVGQFARLILIRAALDTLEQGSADARAAIRDAVPLLLPGIAISILFSFGVGIGMVLLIVPGVILMCMWLIATPVLVRERRGVFDCFARSAELTKGARWHILLLLIILLVFWTVMSGMLGLLAVVVGPTAGVIVSALSNSLLGLFSPAGTAAIYHELRSNKEGMAPSDLEAVFA